MRRGSSRRGYALALVVIFIIIVNMFFVLAWKHFSAAIRVQNAYQTTMNRDEGSLLALAAGLSLLEMQVPPNGMIYKIPFVDNKDDAVWYTVEYGVIPEGEDPKVYSVTVTVAKASPYANLDLYADLRDHIEEIANPPSES